MLRQIAPLLIHLTKEHRSVTVVPRTLPIIQVRIGQTGLDILQQLLPPSTPQHLVRHPKMRTLAVHLAQQNLPAGRNLAMVPGTELLDCLGGPPKIGSQRLMRFFTASQRLDESQPVDLDRREVKVEHGRVLLDGQRTATDDPKSSASRRTVPVEEIQPGTAALLRSLRARQAADRLILGSGYLETGLVLVNALGEPVRPELYSDHFRKLCGQAGLRIIHLHLVRHTLAVAMNRAGVAIVDGAALLGHTPDVYVSTYLRKSEKGARSAASALGAALAGGI